MDIRFQGDRNAIEDQVLGSMLAGLRACDSTCFHGHREKRGCPIGVVDARATLLDITSVAMACSFCTITAGMNY